MPTFPVIRMFGQSREAPYTHVRMTLIETVINLTSMTVDMEGPFEGDTILLHK